MMYVGVDVHKNVCRAAIVNDERVKLLMTMPGLDYFSASLLVAEICDINRFSSDKKLVAWTGLAPGIHQSGDKTVHKRITRQGNWLVRWVMVQAAQTARLHDDRFREFYERYSRRKGHQKAIVAVAHETGCKGLILDEPPISRIE